MLSAFTSYFGGASASASGDGDRSPPYGKPGRPLTPDPPSPTSSSGSEPLPTPLGPPGPGTRRNRFAKVTASEANAAAQSFRPAHQCSQCQRMNFLCLWTADTASQGHAKCGRCRARKKSCDLSMVDPAGGFVRPPQHPQQPPLASLPGLGMMPVRDSDCPPRAAGWSQARVDVTSDYRGRDRGRRYHCRERSQSPTPVRPRRQALDRVEVGGAGGVSGWTPINAAPEVEIPGSEEERVARASQRPGALVPYSSSEEEEVEKEDGEMGWWD